MLALLVIARGVVNAQNVDQWSWQEPQAKVLPTGDLEWAPKAFEFKPGESVRYIDFESGNDANDGLSKQTPWKHHPWDPNAGGQAAACKGAHTYVFKQGVVYRGELNAHESGTAADPHHPDPGPVLGRGAGGHLRFRGGDGLEAGRRQPPHPGAGEGLVRGPRLGAAQRLDGRQGRRRDAHRPGPHAELEHHRPGRHQERVVDVEEPRQAVRQLRYDQRRAAASGVRQGATSTRASRRITTRAPSSGPPRAG